MSVISQPEFVVNSVNTDFQESINKLKSGRKGYIGNLTKCINGVTLLTDNRVTMMKFISYVKKIKFAVFKIKYLTEKHCDLVLEEEINKAEQLCNAEELRSGNINLF